MKLTPKDYKTIKTKSYLKKTNLFFFFNGINQNSNNWIRTKQDLQNLNLSYYKVFNKTSVNIFKSSIYKNTGATINGVTFLIKPVLNNVVITKKVLFNLEPFIFLSLKFNNKIYSFNQVKHINSLNYYNSKLLLYKFGITNIKSNFLVSRIKI
jgi:hypothetical protein